MNVSNCLQTMGFGMAIEILFRGKPPSEKVYEATCKDCKSRLTFKLSDARESSDQRDHGLMIIKCPVCASDVWSQGKEYVTPNKHGHSWRD